MATQEWQAEESSVGLILISDIRYQL